MKPWNWPKRFAVGLGVGIAIACVDSFAFGGEVSPIVIVALLIASTATFGGIWGRGGWPAAPAAWMCVPLAHLVKHVLGLPDTLQPNTYPSILMLSGVHPRGCDARDWGWHADSQAERSQRPRLTGRCSRRAVRRLGCSEVLSSPLAAERHVLALTQEMDRNLRH